jgi:iron only hydrogenase large subunit-like protein
MNSYFHSVTLDREKCVGCTNCIKHCPTEAIRVHEGKAIIINQRCIDCGECIRICPQHAKLAITDSLEAIRDYRYPVALPAPTLYGQFQNGISVDKILTGLLRLGFSRIYEVAWGAELISSFTEHYLKNKSLPTPIISSACPAVVRLIRVRYPELIENILPIISPMEAAAIMVKKELVKEGYSQEDIGVFFISPCAAKFTSVKNPTSRDESAVDGVIAIKDVYGPLISIINKLETTESLQKSQGAGIGWALSGGESRLLAGKRVLAVDGLNNVNKVLEDVVKGKLKEIDFIEGLACSGGCVGGPLTVENPYLAKYRIKILTSCKEGEELSISNHEGEDFTWSEELKPLDVLRLDENMVIAMRKMEEMEQIHKALPGLDCGSCGAPTCHALAEDIVRGHANSIDCIFILRGKISEMAENMLELSVKLPPSIGKK